MTLSFNDYSIVRQLQELYPNSFRIVGGNVIFENEDVSLDIPVYYYIAIERNTGETKYHGVWPGWHSPDQAKIYKNLSQCEKKAKELAKSLDQNTELYIGSIKYTTDYYGHSLRYWDKNQLEFKSPVLANNSKAKDFEVLYKKCEEIENEEGIILPDAEDQEYYRAENEKNPDPELDSELALSDDDGPSEIVPGDKTNGSDDDWMVPSDELDSELALSDEDGPSEIVPGDKTNGSDDDWMVPSNSDPEGTSSLALPEDEDDDNLESKKESPLQQWDELDQDRINYYAKLALSFNGHKAIERHRREADMASKQCDSFKQQLEQNPDDKELKTFRSYLHYGDVVTGNEYLKELQQVANREKAILDVMEKALQSRDDKTSNPPQDKQKQGICVILKHTDDDTFLWDVKKEKWNKTSGNALDYVKRLIRFAWSYLTNNLGYKSVDEAQAKINELNLYEDLNLGDELVLYRKEGSSIIEEKTWDCRYLVVAILDANSNKMYFYNNNGTVVNDLNKATVFYEHDDHIKPSKDQILQAINRSKDTASFGSFIKSELTEYKVSINCVCVSKPEPKYALGKAVESVAISDSGTAKPAETPMPPQESDSDDMFTDLEPLSKPDSDDMFTDLGPLSKPTALPSPPLPVPPAEVVKKSRTLDQKINDLNPSEKSYLLKLKAMRNDFDQVVGLVDQLKNAQVKGWFKRWINRNFENQDKKDWKYQDVVAKL